jgi:hypothetical protein
VSRGPSFWLARLLGWASTACCLIVAASFVVFVVNQTGAASQAQLKELGQSVTPATASAQANHASPSGAKTGTASSTESPLHRWLDDSAETLRSPFSALTSSHSEWYARGLGTLLSLLLYGLVLGYFGRTLALRRKAAG